MKPVVFVPLFILLAVQCFISCKKTSPITNRTQTLSMPAGSPSVIAANNVFAFNFLRATLQQDTVSDNKLISPLSIYLALSMTYNGANNATMDSMADVLQLSGIPPEDLNEVCKALVQQLPKEDNEVQLSIANSIWYDNTGLQPIPSFLNTAEDSYDAVIEPLNFNDPNAVNTINNWVAQHTDDKIPKILTSIDPGDIMYLVNAIYFNGGWASAFDASNTKNNSFYLQNGSVESVPFMNQTIRVNAKIDSSFSIIELPYGGGKSYSMYLVLPTDQEPVNQFASLLNESALTDAIHSMDSMTISLSLPSWEYDYAIDDMKPELSSLGMGIAFGSAADFSNMYQQSVQISKAIHKTYIKVNEQGTQAAASTVVGIQPTVVLSNIVQFNHPFLYAIIEKQTGTVLFIGTLNDPAAH